MEADEENMRIAMTHTIYNELSATKNQNNMQILSVMFQQDHDRSPKVCAMFVTDKHRSCCITKALLHPVVSGVFLIKVNTFYLAAACTPQTKQSLHNLLTPIDFFMTVSL